MYHAIVRRKVTDSFAALSRGDYEVPLAAMAPRFEHIFAGAHPLGGTRHTVPTMRRWFERLFRLNEHLNFTIKHIAVSGWPWDTTIVVEWRDSATLASGESYVNDGTHIVRMRWGKVVALHAYLDTALFADACRRMAEAGIAEAAADPIED
jgi:ketosteroid isomerase-like protein